MLTLVFNAVSRLFQTHMTIETVWITYLADQSIHLDSVFSTKLSHAITTNYYLFLRARYVLEPEPNYENLHKVRMIVALLQEKEFTG